MILIEIFVFQLFRRVAAALPGMDSTENRPPEDSILSIFQASFYRLHASINCALIRPFCASALTPSFRHLFICPTICQDPHLINSLLFKIKIIHFICLFF